MIELNVIRFEYQCFDSFKWPLSFPFFPINLTLQFIP
jgi:hypothetical protein